ncbi:hypothetical protein A5706_13760 [Mycobacterium sp. E796]|nr:hypothetical protein A5706_13760 [Mycobacterium sp. E796]
MKFAIDDFLPYSRLPQGDSVRTKQRISKSECYDSGALCILVSVEKLERLDSGDRANPMISYKRVRSNRPAMPVPMLSKPELKPLATPLGEASRGR